MLLLAFLPFVAAFYGMALRLAGPAAAVLVTFLGIAWSVPNYFASLPSWYNLFFATLGGLALFRHLEDGKARWLFLAGLCGGVSMLFKVVGLYFVAAALLFLAYRETALSAGGRPGKRDRLSAFFLVKLAGAAGLVAALVLLQRDRLSPMHVFHFVLPAIALTLLLLQSEWADGGGAFGERAARLVRMVGPFVAGVVLPVALFVVPYATTGSLPDLARGVFLRPMQQIATAKLDLPPIESLWPAIPYALLLLFPLSVARIGRRAAIGIPIALAALLVLAFVPAVYKAIWLSARSAAPLATLVGCIALARPRERSEASDRVRQRLFLLLCLAALVSLVQFPFAAPIYFCYVAPIAFLAVTSLVTLDPRAPRALHAKVAAFYLLFGVVFLNSGYVSNLGFRYERYVADGRLAVERGGLRVPAADAKEYGALVAAIGARDPGPEIYAGPDCPEVYFLSGRRNPTRSFFEFIGPFGSDPEALLPLLDARGIRLVVLNRSPGFTARPNLAFSVALKPRYPNRAFIGDFLLMWRD